MSILSDNKGRTSSCSNSHYSLTDGVDAPNYSLYRSLVLCRLHFGVIVFQDIHSVSVKGELVVCQGSI